MNTQGAKKMGTNREEYEGEEGEYQFSDDNINYDIDDETKVAEPPPPPLSTKQKLLEKLGPYRRMIIGLAVFVVILFVVYKMLAPGTTTPPTDFSPDSTANPITQTPAATKQPVVPATVSPPSQPTPKAVSSQSPMTQIPGAPTSPPATPLTPSTQPASISPPVPQQPSAVSPPVPQFPSAPTQPLPTSSVSTSSGPTAYPAPTAYPPAAPVPPQPAAVNPGVPIQPAAQPVSTNVPSSMPSAIPPPPLTIPQSEIANKIGALESQNANMLNTMQTQFAQKMADYELQTKVMQERVLVLNKRLANMEATLNKMAQMLREGGGRSSAPPVSTVVRSVEPKMTYTVQAIIPGRAWLKSESGDTVTVAENDLLKDYGRIVKIDPYDGIVQIDNGSRIITLSYGSGGD